MASSKHRNPIARTCVSTQTRVPSNTITRNDNSLVSPTLNWHSCKCFLRKRQEKEMEIVTPLASEMTNFKPATLARKTCDGCYSRRETTNREVKPYTDSITEFLESYDDISIPSTPSTSSERDLGQRTSKIGKNDNNLTPKEIMNSWMPSRENKPASRFLTPSDNYVDVSPNDFSLRKYCPEFFLSDTQKRELRAKELEETQSKQKSPFQPYYRDVKCPQASCGAKEIQEVPDWQRIDDDSNKQAHCSWSDRELVVALERDVKRDEESNVKLQIPSKRSFKRFFCPCSNVKREKKSNRKKKDTKRT